MVAEMSTDQEKLCEAAEEARRIRLQMEQFDRKLRAWCDEAPVEPPASPVGPPLDEIIVRRPGTPSVFSWQALVDLPITARLQGDTIYISWPAMLTKWPTEERDLGQGMQPYSGNSGLVYRTVGGDWVADATEWMRPGREDFGTSYEYDRKWRHGEPDLSYPVGLFVAGLWRYSADLPQYHRRTKVKWLTWPGLELVGSE